MRCLIFYIFNFCCWSAFGQSYPVKHFSANDGLASNLVYDAVQDNQGFMWFATNIGVSRFDGKEWNHYTINDGLGDNEILKIKKDNKGRLWLFGFNGAVNIIENSKIYSEQNHPVLKQLSKGFFYRHFFSNDNDEIFLSNKRTNAFFIDYQKSAIKKLNPEGTLGFFNIQGKILEIDFKSLYKLPEDITNNQNLNIQSKVQLISSYIHNKTLLAIVDDVILKIDSTGRHSIFKIELPETFNILDFYFTDENELWIVADKQGIYQYKKNGDEYVIHKKLLTESHITSSWKDNEGNYWFTSYGSGIFMYPYNFENIITYNRNDGLIENDAFAICVDKLNNIWIGHKYVNIDRIEKQSISNIKLSSSQVSVGRIGKILEHPDGHMIVSSDEGLFISKSKWNDKYYFENIELEISNNKMNKFQPIKDMVIDKKGDIYIASQENIHLISKNEISKKNIIGRRMNISQNRIFAVEVDENGVIWYSDSEGLAAFEDNKIKRFPSLSPYIKTRIEDIVAFKDCIYLSVLGTGILVLKEGKLISHLTTEQGLVSNHCSKLYPFNDVMFICTNKGLNTLRIGSDHNIKIETVSSPMTTFKQINDVFVNEQSIYLATLDGITILPNKITQDVFTSTNVYFTNINYKGVDVKENGNIVLDFNDRHIIFEFTSPAFYHPEGIKYQYKLNNNVWTTINNPLLELNELRPGNYSLQVKAKHNNLSWTRPITYNFAVATPFYLSWWFYTSLFIIIISFVTFSNKRRLKRIRNEQQMKLEYEQEINKLQLKSLQAMMNPHFVFNSLSAIQQQINAGENENANIYLTRFSKLLRKNLETINELYVTIEEEIIRLKLYLDTEKTRLGNKLNYTIHCQEGLEIYDIYIPTMLLQPLVENAIWHGIMPSEHTGEVSINFRESHGMIQIEINDNGIGYETSMKSKLQNLDKSQNLGISITKARLKYLEQKLKKPIHITIEDLSKYRSNGTRILIEMDKIID